ncbi:Hint domain-containing protein [Pacificibacter maritimus]|uniref:Hint domain-containing protein n=1 Tax=Pacificibacter maritimus TaxID=762213 RepID=A0A3N4V2E7_9RHOB|nr:Hint domain-containing protein [Pacificibacter maritimus]
MIWIARRELALENLVAQEKMAPIKICKNALGDGFPQSDVVVSRQHRIFVQSKIVSRMFGSDGVLVPAKDLTDLPGVEIMRDLNMVTYYHLMCKKHQVIFANGMPSESLYAGIQAIESLGKKPLNSCFQFALC